MKLTPPIIQKRIRAFKEHCRQEGLSLTHQRLGVYSRLAATLEHPTAEELHTAMHAEYPTVSLGTVYKTLDTFEHYGLITKLRATGESARYDANLEPHHHLVCKRCGRMQDVEGCSAVSQQFLEKEYANFEVEEVRVDFRGTCGPCRAKTK